MGTSASIKIKKRTSSVATRESVKVLSDTDDRITLALQRAEKRSRKRNKQIESMHKPKTDARDFERGNFLAKTKVHRLAPPMHSKTIPNAETSKEAQTALALHHLKYRETKDLSLSLELADQNIPGIRSLKYTTRKTAKLKSNEVFLEASLKEERRKARILKSLINKEQVTR